MKNSEIVKMAEEVSKKLGLDQEREFFIGCKTDEVLPNNKVTKLICVDCSWLKPQQSAIIDRNDLDIIEGDENSPSIKISSDEIIFTKWVDMVDMDGDVHHCKVESYLIMDEEGDPFNPIESTDWVIYIEL